MNRSDELLFEPRVADWLEDDPHTAPDQVLDVVLAAFPSINQRRALPAPWRFRDLSSLKPAFAAAAVVVAVSGLVLLGIWFPSDSIGQPETDSLPASPVAVAPPTVEPSIRPTAAPVTGLPGTLLFRRDDGPNGDSYLMRPDRTGVVQLTSDILDDNAPVLSPDGTRVAFQRDNPIAPNAEIWIVNADGTGELPLTMSGTPEDWPSWSPDGTAIAFSRATISKGAVIEQAIVIRDVASGAERVVVSNQGDAENWARYYIPSWSPDGTRIAFTSDLSGSDQLHTINVDGTGLTTLTTVGAGGRPAWSPDSSKLAYPNPMASSCIWIVAADGSSKPDQLPTGACTGGPAAWSPDGSMIAWAGGTQGAPIRVVNLDGSNPRVIMPGFKFGDVSWSALEP
jgi:Tol biopolymer transport system component